MADRDNTVVISTSLETRSAIKSLGDLKREISSAFKKPSTSALQNRVVELTKDLDDAKVSAEKAREAFDAMSSGDVEPKSVQDLKAELERVQKNAEKADTAIAKLIEQEGKLKDQGLTEEGAAKARQRAIKQGRADIPHFMEIDGRYFTGEQVAKLEEINAKINELSSQSYHAKTDVELLNLAINQNKERALLEAQFAVEDADRKVIKLTDDVRIAQKEADKGGSILADAFERARNSGNKLLGMMKRMTIRLLFYQTFGKAIRSTVDYIKEAVKADNELSRSVAQLKGNILTAFQLIYQVVRPIILGIIKLLTWLIGLINQLISRLTGKSITAAQKSAKAMYGLSKATGSAGKEAKKKLASFDELIQIGDKSEAGSGGAADTGISPDFVDPEQFTLTDNIRDALEAIWGILKYIIAAIATWKLLVWLTDILTTINRIKGVLSGFGNNGPLATIAGILLIAVGLVELIENYSDAWINGLDWENFAGILFGLSAIIGGLVLIFGDAVLPIALIASGLGLIVIAIHDLIKNGPNIKNQLLITIGLLGTVVGLIMSGHTALGLIIAIIGTAILIAGNFGDQWENIMEHCGDIVNGFVNLVKDLINGDFDKAWEDAKQILSGFVNLGIDLFEGLVKAAAKAINKIIEAINSLKISIPDWVPLFGGKEYSPNLKTISTNWSLPRLAQGAVIPPNKEFLAMLGDQRHGTNIEAPLDTMVEAFTNALDSRNSEQNINIRFTGSLAEVARLLKPYIDDEGTRQGRKSSNGLIVGGI